MTDDDAFEELCRLALGGDEECIDRMVQALRAYRKAVESMLDARYHDGECDGATLSMFAGTIDEINDALLGEED